MPATPPKAHHVLPRRVTFAIHFARGMGDGSVLLGMRRAGCFWLAGQIQWLGGLRGRSRPTFTRLATEEYAHTAWLTRMTAAEHTLSVLLLQPPPAGTASLN